MPMDFHCRLLLMSTSTMTGDSKVSEQEETNLSKENPQVSKEQEKESSSMTEMTTKVDNDEETEKPTSPATMEVDLNNAKATVKVEPPESSGLSKASIDIADTSASPKPAMEVDEDKPTDNTPIVVGTSSTAPPESAATKQDQESEQMIKVVDEQKSKPLKPVYVPEDWAVEEESEEEDEGIDPFVAFKKTTDSYNTQKKKNKKKKSTSLVIQLIPKDKETINDPEENKKAPTDKVENNENVVSNIYDDDGYLEEGFSMEDEEEAAALIFEEEFQHSLEFFKEPHEDQDQAFSNFQKDKKKKEYREQLQALAQKDKEGRQHIEIIISDLMKSKQASTNRSVEKYREKSRDDERRDLQKLRQIYTEKNNSNQQKINQGIKVLQSRHQAEGQKALEHHRHQSAQRRLPDQIAQAEWQNIYSRLKFKQQRQLSDFSKKGDEVKLRCEAEYKRDQEKLRKQYEKRLQDVERNRQSIYSRIYQGFQQLRQRYMKRHIQRITKRKSEIMKALKELEGEKDLSTIKIKEEAKAMSPRDIVKSSMEEKVELRVPSPIKTSGNWFEESTNEKSGAAIRHKHRKGVLSQINKQLSVEIHNEGIWVDKIVEQKVNDADNKSSGRKDGPDATKSVDADEKCFIPWGVKARELLESIICGEIPHGYGADRFDFGDSVLINGGHIRCVMTDLRTSDATASVQRAASVHDKEVNDLSELQKTLKDATRVVNENEKILAKLEKQQLDIRPKVQEAIKDAESKQIQFQNFRTRYSKYLTHGKYIDYAYVFNLMHYNFST